MVSRATLDRVADIITTQALSIRETEIQKLVLVNHKEFVVLNAFCRISNQKQLITTLDLVEFFRENGLVVSEGDCYMLVTAFDKKGNGMLSLGDMMLMLAPSSYNVKRNMRGCQKYFQYGAPKITLTHDIEFAVMNVLQL